MINPIKEQRYIITKSLCSFIYNLSLINLKQKEIKMKTRIIVLTILLVGIMFINNVYAELPIVIKTKGNISLVKLDHYSFTTAAYTLVISGSEDLFSIMVDSDDVVAIVSKEEIESNHDMIEFLYQFDGKVVHTWNSEAFGKKMIMFSLFQRYNFIDQMLISKRLQLGLPITVKTASYGIVAFDLSDFDSMYNEMKSIPRN